jgi:hypothetical protein
VERVSWIVPVEDDLALLERAPASDREHPTDVLGRESRKERRFHGHQSVSPT